MFKLEKVFQNNDSAYLYFVSILKAIFIFLTIYFFSILQNNTIYDFLDFEIFLNSIFFSFSIILSSTYLFLSLFIRTSKYYNQNFISYLREDVLNIFFSMLLIFATYFILRINFPINIDFLYLTTSILLILSISKAYFNILYNSLIKNNIIQKNVLLVGNCEEIRNILKNDIDNIYVLKCCIILDINKYNEKLLKSEIKFPIFSNDEDIRSILEYK